MGGAAFTGAKCGSQHPISGFRAVHILDLRDISSNKFNLHSQIMADFEYPFPCISLPNGKIITGSRYIGRAPMREASFSEAIMVDYK